MTERFITDTDGRKFDFSRPKVYFSFFLPIHNVQDFHKVAVSSSDALIMSLNVLSVVAVDEDPSPSSVVDGEEAP